MSYHRSLWELLTGIWFMVVDGKPSLRLLIIDDSADETSLLIRLLQKEFRVAWRRVDTEADLLVSLHESKWDTVLCDYNLPRFDPYRALRVVQKHSVRGQIVDIPFIVISGVVQEDVAIDLLRKGARDFISKDHLERLPLAIRREIRNNLERLKDRFQIAEAYDATIAAWGKALELRDRYTMGHTERVTALSLQLAIELGLPHNQFIDLNRGAFLHDIGKIGIPDAVLLKRDELTLEELKIIKQHPQLGYDMLKDVPFLEKAAIIPLCHHERWNGTGYPQGLMGSENPFPEGKGIPLLARIFSIVDVYDALTTDRPYRPSWEKDKAIAYIASERRVSFDPDIVDVFVDLVRRG